MYLGMRSNSEVRSCHPFSPNYGSLLEGTVLIFPGVPVFFFGGRRLRRASVPGDLDLADFGITGVDFSAAFPVSTFLLTGVVRRGALLLFRAELWRRPVGHCALEVKRLRYVLGRRARHCEL